MKYCQACRVNYTDKEMNIMNMKMHVFPRRDWQRNFLISWLSFCGMPLQSDDLKNKWVCSLHFAPEDYFPGGNRRLRLDAVPHLCPPSELVADGDPTKNIATKPPAKKNLYDVGRREMVENVKRQLCRLCGKRESILRPIFNESSEATKIDSSIATKINMYLPVKVEEDESLPCNICQDCAGLLTKYHELNITCVAVDKILRKTFGVDETDELFMDPNDKSDEALQSERYKKHIRQTVARVVKEHNILIRAVTKPLEKREFQYTDGSATLSLRRKQFVCGYCGEGFELFKLRTKHITVCREMPGICEVCGKQLPRKELKRHSKQAHGIPKDYMCDKCAKCFRSMQTLDYHTKLRHESKPDIKYYCEHCCKTFCTKASYENHLKSHENGNMNLVFSIETNGLDEGNVVYKCPVCGQIFDDKLSLIVHMNAPNEIHCGICQTRFLCEKRYLVHMSSDKWMCQHCSKVSCYKHHAITHERLHTGERPFRCMVCSLRFRTHSLKIKHQATHHPPEFKCTFCGKQFRYKGPFDDHMNVHKGASATCVLCNKTFNGNFALRRHTLRFHKMKKKTFRIEAFEPVDQSCQNEELQPQTVEIDGFLDVVCDENDIGNGMDFIGLYEDN